MNVPARQQVHKSHAQDTPRPQDLRGPNVLVGGPTSIHVHHLWADTSLPAPVPREGDLREGAPACGSRQPSVASAALNYHARRSLPAARVVVCGSATPSCSPCPKGTPLLDEVSERELEAELARRKHERSPQEAERKRSIEAEAAAKTRGRVRSPSKAPVGSTREFLYDQLGAKSGAPMTEVERAYRALMRENHPDRHAGDAKKQKAASDRAASLTTAYA